MDSATPCLCVRACVCVIPVLSFEHSSPCFTHKIQFPTGVQIITRQRTSLPSLFQKPHQVTLNVVVMAVFVRNVCSLCKKLWTSASVKPWDVLYSLHLRTPLLLSVDLKIAFWFLNDRKHREDYFGISVIFFNIFLYKSLCFSFAFC